MQRNEEEVRGLRAVGIIDWIYRVRLEGTVHGYVPLESAEGTLFT